MTFHDNPLWQKAYVALLDIYQLLDTIDDGEKVDEKEIIEQLLLSAQHVTSKIADGLSRTDRRYGKNLLFDAVGLVAVVRTHLAVCWGRGIFNDDEFRGLDGKYEDLTQALQNYK